ncbi:carbohydrate ABC transporter permease [Rothia aerolata]|uniref:ABC transporter permease n=1 Tax=Rothia aerolata TaxID=1812262 RepID=A0A917IUK0_9MICC|nr:carbohydrate ABC transporter permease [Rothia aerolata]GGH64363.1 ABC transporter permease [Rothia aerolata]
MAFDYQVPAVPAENGLSEPTQQAKEAEVPQRSGTAPAENRRSKIWGYLGLALATLIVALPLYFVLMTSFKTHGDIYSNPVSWIPSPFAPENYSYVWNTLNFDRYFLNSVIITVSLVIIEVSFGVLSAYAFAFIRFPGSSLLFFLVIGTLMVPNEITIISNYALVAQLGWRNTFTGIIVPLAGVAFGTFLMRNHFRSLPKEIFEAATMDGAGFFRTLFKVVLPMSWPTLMAFVLITAVTEWNQYLWPFLVSDTEKVAPLQIGLTQLQDVEGLTNWGPVMAGTILTTIPMIVLFLLLQKSMIKGLTAGAVKG